MIARVREAIRRLRENQQLLVICLATVIVMACQGVIVPILPEFARSFGVRTAIIGIAVSAFGIGRLVVNVPLGMVADRYGRRVVLIGGPLVTSAAMLGCAFSPNIGVFLFWRVITGVGSAMYMTGAQIYLADISTPANRAKNIATNQGALFLGVSVGPALGGFLAEWFGLKAPFIVVGVIVLFAALHAYLRLPETRPARATDAHGVELEQAQERSVRPLLRSPDFLAVSAVTFSIFLTRSSGQQLLIPLHGRDELGLSPSQLGLVFTLIALVGMVGLAPSAFLADRFGRKWAIVPSGLIAASGLVLLGLSNNTAVFVGAAVLYSGGMSIGGPAPAAYAADIVPAHLRGIALGMFRSVGDLGIVTGPFVMAALADATSVAFGLAATGSVVAAACIAFGLVATETVHRDHQVEPDEELMVTQVEAELETL